MALVRLVSRKSNLALIQAREVATAIRAADPALDVEIVPVTSAGDRSPHTRIEVFDTTGIFTKALEEALLDGAGDAAVHSAKDLPTSLDPRFEIVSYLRRGDRRDALVVGGVPVPEERLAASHHGSDESAGGFLDSILATGAVVATGSVRRRAQLSRLRPDLTFIDLRGNMERRLQALDRCDAVVAAACALDRLGVSEASSAGIAIFRIDEETVVPAAGQGVIAVEAMTEGPFGDLLRHIGDDAAAAEVNVERAFLGASRAGCTAPVGVTAHLLEEDRLAITSVACSKDGHRSLTARYEVGSAEEAARAGAVFASQASELWAIEASLVG